MATSDLEFWFEFGSTYSSLSAVLIEGAANAVDTPIRSKPFLSGPVFAE
jgi:2-hydroxychromene-2-carboxylate isomerase